ncbi:MAG: FecCD family ABC transporter permease [Tissierella sp.]|uniref:FecCD family ABC transporter permease n=1 Tax=Tissierella sp. TaxID=41274 RepID=UPI003F95080F
MKIIFKKAKYKTIILSLTALLVLSIGFFSTIGTADVSVVDIFKIIGSKIPFINKSIDIMNIKDSYKNIIWNIRLPRVVLGVLVGMSLSITGGSFQALFQNPMADPYIIGISSGAALGATLSIVLKLNFSILNISNISLFAFIGGLIAVFLVYNISKIKNKVPTTTLLLAGVAVGQFFTAIMSFMMVLNNKDMSKIIYWTLGSLSGKGWEPILTLGPIIIIAIFIMNFYARDLNILLTGEESAESLGVNVEKTKVYILILGTLITSLVVSISGIIGFVGLIIPHIVRLMLGPDHRILLPSSALIGGVFMVFADTIARTIISPIEIPVGIITALFGGPFFIYLLINSKKGL